MGVKEGLRKLIDINTAKRTYPLADENKLALIEDEATADQTGAEIKTAYESNANTNAYTDAEKSKLASITEIFTTALKNAYDNSVTWISTNGTNILNHVSSTLNPHNVNASQVGLGNVDNTSDVNKPISTAMQTALDVLTPTTSASFPIDFTRPTIFGTFTTPLDATTFSESEVGALVGIVQKSYMTGSWTPTANDVNIGTKNYNSGAITPKENTDLPF